jgi:hypothetical protein
MSPGAAAVPYPLSLFYFLALLQESEGSVKEDHARYRRVGSCNKRCLTETGDLLIPAVGKVCFFEGGVARDDAAA